MPGSARLAQTSRPVRDADLDGRRSKKTATVAALLLAGSIVPVLPASGSAASAAASSPPRSIRVSATQLFRLAEQARLRGDAKTAAALLDALATDPDSDTRAEARFRLAKQLLAENRPAAAALHLRRILDEKPKAAGVRFQLAQVLQQLGDTDGALRELRSAQAGGLPPDVARLIDRYSQAVRATRPTGINFEVALAPDSNINRATRSDTLGTVIGDFDIAEDSQAKSGTGLALRGQAYRRFATASDRATLLVRASASSDLYRHEEFNDLAVDIAAGPELQLGRNRINVEAGVTQRWFGQKPVVRSARIGATLSRPLGQRTMARVSGSASLIANRLNDLQSGKGYFAKVSLERALSASTGIAASLSYDRQALKDPGYSSRGWRAGLAGWHDLGRATVTVSASLGRLKADERLILFPEKRSDRYWSCGIGATFRQLTIGGFAPVARVSIERNRSTIEFHDYSRRRTEIGLVRAF